MLEIKKKAKEMSRQQKRALAESMNYVPHENEDENDDDFYDTDFHDCK